MTISARIGKIWVSTVPICMAQPLSDTAQARWMTMVFIGKEDHGQHTYTSLKAAREGHAYIVNVCKRHWVKKHGRYFWQRMKEMWS